MKKERSFYDKYFFIERILVIVLSFLLLVAWIVALLKEKNDIYSALKKQEEEILAGKGYKAL